MNKRVPFKRRRKGLTNYKKRLGLVISKKPRLVVRVSNKYINCQLIKYSSDGDVTLATLNSKKLSDYGFKGGKNLQSAYLTGLACGLLGVNKGVKNAILDIGLKPSIKNSRIYACLKGVIDAGVKVPHGDVLPSDEFIKKAELKKSIELIVKKVKKTVNNSKTEEVKKK